MIEAFMIGFISAFLGSLTATLIFGLIASKKIKEKLNKSPLGI